MTSEKMIQDQTVLNILEQSGNNLGGGDERGQDKTVGGTAENSDDDHVFDIEKSKWNNLIIKN